MEDRASPNDYVEISDILGIWHIVNFFGMPVLACLFLVVVNTCF